MGRNSFFQFKQFRIEQDKCAMKVGTDGVLLGAWCDVNGATRILDVGTGTGLIAMMVAQRACDNASITAIDIDKDAADQARQNSETSPWSDRIQVFNISLQDLDKKEKFDLIVCNPPYFTDSLKAPDAQRTTARHNDSLSIGDLVENSKLLLNASGRICVILPVKEGKQFVDKCHTCGLCVTKVTEVVPKPLAEVKRLLIEASVTARDMKNDKIQIEKEERHMYTEEFKKLTSPYYLDK